MAGLFADKSAVPIEQAYKVATLLERPGAKEVILQAAKNLAREGEGKRAPSEVLRLLAGSLDRSKKLTPGAEAVQRRRGQTRDGHAQCAGQSHVGFPARTSGGVEPQELLTAVKQILKDLGR